MQLYCYSGVDACVVDFSAVTSVVDAVFYWDHAMQLSCFFRYVEIASCTIMLFLMLALLLCADNDIASLLVLLLVLLLPVCLYCISNVVAGSVLLSCQ
jgi:hypothetical protein